MALADKLEQLPARPGVYLFKDKTGAIVYVGKARVLRDRVRSYFQAWRPAEQRKTSLVGRDRRPRADRHRQRDGGARPREQPDQAPPPHYNVLLRDDKNHPYLKLTLNEEYPRLYVVRRRGRGRERLRRPLHPGQLGRADRRTRPPRLRDPLLQGGPERQAAAALPAVPDQALPGALRGRDLPARPLSPGRRGRATVPGGTHGRGDAPAPRADGGGRARHRFEEAATLRDQVPRPRAAGGAAEDHHHRHRGARRLRRPTSRASARRCRSSPCATARWWRARASCSTA